MELRTLKSSRHDEEAFHEGIKGWVLRIDDLEVNGMDARNHVRKNHMNFTFNIAQ